ncbi:MAG TPA: hypothetical protein VNS52_12455 [Gemmatimonadaceae bacterium]|nr:hypothetical protein [Gemmatimonadaceae bacterium]
MQEFTYRQARSGSLMAGLGGAIAVETIALHLWLAAKDHPLVAWALTAGSVSALAWIAADYRALGSGAVRVGHGRVDLRVGRRFALELPADAVAAAVARPSWRELPAAGTPAARDYLNLTKPATPNVLLMLAEPTAIRLPGGLTRRDVRRLGLCLDDPTGFVSAVASPTSA